MVSMRCKNFVKDQLKKIGIDYSTIDLGMVDIPEEIRPEVRVHLKKELNKSGLELMDDKRSVLIEDVKRLITESIHDFEEVPVESYVDFITEKLQCDYRYLSSIFAEVEGITLQKFIIISKIEKAKELLIYDDLNLTEISYKLQYSSVAHLSNQFKKVTGLAPSFFKQLQHERKSNLQKAETL
jgi:AraC-like DNA-binding protein